MATRDLLLAIDNGTQSVRALLFDAAGDLVAKTRVALGGYRSPRAGWHEHDANEFWESVCTACRLLWAKDSRYRERIAGVAVTTQRASMVAVDASGEPLRPAITWLDQRKCVEVPPLSLRWRAAFALAGLTATVQSLQRDAEANWLRTHEPAIWARTAKFLLLSGFLNYRLCGHFVDSTGSQVGYIPFDYRRLCWAAPGEWQWEATQITPQMLPDLVPPGTQLGEITRRAAEASGIAEGTPLIAAAADKACEVLGAGCIDSDVACLSYGTAATINVNSRRYVEPIRFIPPYPSAMPGAYNLEVQVFRGYWMVDWFREQFGMPEILAAQQSGTVAETLFDKLVEQVPAGSDGLVLQPYWSPGLKQPGPEARGAIVGFSDVHTRAHVYRAMLEGLAYALRDGKERIERRGRFDITGLRVCGGGSQSDAALQLTADIFNLPAARPHVYEASGLGAAVTVAVGTGIHPNFETAASAMTHIARTFEPLSAHRQIYDELYGRVYRKMYRQLRPLYSALRHITAGG
jgi:sugar (pentulose or hexulose) kinase